MGRRAEDTLGNACPRQQTETLGGQFFAGFGQQRVLADVFTAQTDIFPRFDWFGKNDRPGLAGRGLDVFLHDDGIRARMAGSRR